MRALPVLILLSALASSGCAVTIEVTPDNTTITAPQLDQCEGIEVVLTIRQGNKPTREIQTVVQDGALVFSSRNISDYDFSAPFTFELRVQQHGSEPCPFPSLALWLANNKRLTGAGGRRYEISASEFTRQ